MKASHLLVVPVAIASVWLGYCTFSPSLFSAVTSNNILESTFVQRSNTIVEEKAKDKTKPITIAIGGDVMLDRQIRARREQSGYDIFSEDIAEAFATSNISLVNLEGPVTTNPSISLSSEIGSLDNFVFTFAPESLAALTKAGIDFVSLGNNHITNQGPEGVSSTKTYLESVGIRYFGSPYKDDIATTTVHDTTIGFIAYNQFIPPEDTENFLTNITSLSQENDFVIVMPHWGYEYEFTPSAEQIALAHAFIDAGADVVIGAHPHVIQTFETYNNRAIAYSVGNLIFDQWFNNDVRSGVILFLKLDPLSRTYTTYPMCTRLNNDGTTTSTECPATITSNASMIGTY